MHIEGYEDKLDNKFLKNFRAYFLIAMIYFSIFVSEYNIGNNKLEWFLVFDLVIIIDIFINRLKIKKRSKNPIINYMIIFVFYNVVLIIISIFVSRNNFIVGIMHLGRVIGLFVFYVWINYTFDSSNLAKFIKNFLISLYVFGMYFIADLMLIHKFSYYTLYGLFSPRLEFGNLKTNLLAYILVVFIIFIQTFEKKLFRKSVFILIFIFLIVQTVSKMAILALVIYFTLKLFTIEIKKKHIKLIVIFYTIAILFIIVILFGEKILEYNMFYRIKEIIDILLSGGSMLDTSEMERISIQGKFLNDNEWNPIIGYYYYYFFANNSVTLHNFYIELLYDTGIIGLTIFMKLIYEFHKKITNKKIFILLIIIIYNLTENYFFYFVPLILFYIMLEYESFYTKS